jgi:hypothetical protein
VDGCCASSGPANHPNVSNNDSAIDLAVISVLTPVRPYWLSFHSSYQAI